MIILKELVELVAKTIAGGVEFSAMRSLVADMEDKNLSGSEKREKVLEGFAQIGYGLAGWVVNALLELAIIYIRSIVK